MKVLDPQSALLSNAEVWDFLNNNPPRKADKKSGAYEPVNLKDYHNVRKDFKRYIDLAAPHIKEYPPPQTFIANAVKRLRKYDLTKTECLTFINLGLGIPRSQAANVNVEINGQTEDPTEVTQEDGQDERASGDDAAEPAEVVFAPAPNAGSDAASAGGSIEPSFRALVDCIIEVVGERFPGEEGEQKIQEMLSVLQECVEEAKKH